MGLPIFAVTLFISAFILFLVQPIVGKMILPKLGGTPQVWNTCMVFFQAVLLAGYGYTHYCSTRLTIRRQILVHAVLLLIPIALLVPPLGPLNVKGWAPSNLGGNPVLPTLILLATVVGLPFFVVATSAPLLQKWFAYTGDKAARDPYFLYAASNAGSMLALLAYPFFVEWIMPLDMQTITWAIGYGLLVVLVLVCAWRVWQTAPAMKLAPVVDVPKETAPTPAPPSTEITATPPAPSPAPAAPPPSSLGKGGPGGMAADRSAAIKKPAKHLPKGPRKDLALETPTIPHATDELTTWRRIRWIGLGAVPSSLMLGITAHITTDLSPIPLFWLIPLTLYLLSFILVFSRWPVEWTGKPHETMLFAQPIALGLMVFFAFMSPRGHGAVGLFSFPIMLSLLAFFLTALVCHGELARDRPSTKYLTEFYLLMSVGGVVGGIFNALLAPVVFTKGNLEYPLAIIAACLFRPKMKDSGWTDDLLSTYLDRKAVDKKGKHVSVAGTDTPTFHYIMDGVLAGSLLVLALALAFFLGKMFFGDPNRVSWDESAYFLIFGFPVAIACFYLFRPLRLGGAIAALLLVHAFFQETYVNRNIVYRDRSYFGFIRVREGNALMPRTQEYLNKHYELDLRKMNDGETGFDRYFTVIKYTNLMHGNIDHGKNFQKPADKKDWFHPDKDFSRLPTTYYHQWGPAGRVMRKFNWFNWETDELNNYKSDARMPASLAALAAGPHGFGMPGVLPVAQLGGLWSEPPYATIGLGTGTMASYGRPFQHVHFYEIDNYIRKLSLPLKGGALYEFKVDNKVVRTGPFFSYLEDADKRGSIVQVLMGDARLRMAFPYQTYHEDREKRGQGAGGGPDNFYHMMVVDAFSSDAIPVHLLTREAFIMYFQKLTRKGILCVHTSNRYVDLVKVVAQVSESIHLVEIDDYGDLDKKDALFGRRTADKKEVDRKNHMLESAGMRPMQFKEDNAPLVWYRAHDNSPGYINEEKYKEEERETRSERRFGHYTSEWVMVAREKDLLLDRKLAPPKDYQINLTKENDGKRKYYESRGWGTGNIKEEPYWDTFFIKGKHVWTDDYSNLMGVLR